MPPPSPSTALLALLLGGILAIFVVALRRRDYASAINAAGSVALAGLPLLLSALAPLLLDTTVTVGHALPLWLAAAGLLHSIGMLGPYDTIPWWDVLTHATTAALLAALVYAGLLVVGTSTLTAGILTVVGTLFAGVFWELLELVARDVGRHFDVEPVLVVYGWRDTAGDLVVNVVAAIVVVSVDLRVFVPLAAQAEGATRLLLVAGGGALVVGCVVLSALVAWDPLGGEPER